MQNIYVIIGEGYTMDRVIAEIQEEQYSHNFFFGQGKTYAEKEQGMKVADEVWCFNDCRGIEDLKLARTSNKDIWQMSSDVR